MAETMRAVYFAGAGGEEVIEVRQIARPAAVGDRVLVRVLSAGLNRADLLQRRGRYPAPPGAPEHVPGLEFAGVVERVGDEVTKWRAGQRVCGIAAGGAQAEYVVAPESTLVEIPPSLDWAEAAAVPEAFITAHDALFTQGDLQMGESALVHAAGSGVGLAAVQLVRAAGATPYGTARTQEKLSRAREFGLADAIVVGDDSRVFADAVRRWTDGAGVNVVLDLVGASYLNANLESLAARGRLLLVGTVAGAQAELNFGTVMRRRLKIIGTVLRSRTTEEKARATALFAAHVMPLLARGAVRPVIDSVYDLSEARDAHRRLESNESFGKVILTIGQ